MCLKNSEILILHLNFTFLSETLPNTLQIINKFGRLLLSSMEMWSPPAHRADVSMQRLKLRSGAGCSANPGCNWQEVRGTEETDCNYLIWNLAKTPWLAFLLCCKSVMKSHSTAGFATHWEVWSKDGQTLKNWKIWSLLAGSCKLFSSGKCTVEVSANHMCYIFLIFLPPAIPSLVFSTTFVL